MGRVKANIGLHMLEFVCGAVRAVSQAVQARSPRIFAHHTIVGDDEAAHVICGHSADGVKHRVPLVDLVVDVEVARLLPRVLCRAHVWKKRRQR